MHVGQSVTVQDDGVQDDDGMQDDVVRGDGGDVVTVTPCEDGPLLVRGAFMLVTQDGEPIDPGRATVALCRCGGSSTKPFCDGSHKAIGFRASSEPDPPPAA